MDYSVDGDDFSDGSDTSDDSALDLSGDDNYNTDIVDDIGGEELDSIPDLDTQSSDDVADILDDIPEDGVIIDDFNDDVLDEIPEDIGGGPTIESVDDEIPTDELSDAITEVPDTEEPFENDLEENLQEVADEAVSSELGEEESEAILEDMLAQESSEDTSDVGSNESLEGTQDAPSEMPDIEASLEDNTEANLQEVADETVSSELGEEESEAILEDMLAQESSEDTSDVETNESLEGAQDAPSEMPDIEASLEDNAEVNHQEVADEAVSSELGEEESEAILEDMLAQESGEDASDVHLNESLEDMQDASSEMPGEEEPLEDNPEDEYITNLDELQSNPNDVSEEDVKTLGTYPVAEGVEEYSTEQHLSDIHDTLAEVYGIPEGSPELETIMENEASGHEDLQEAHENYSLDEVIDTKENIGENTEEIVLKSQESSDIIDNSLDDDEGFNRAAFNELTDYMSSHDYQRGDFNTYSTDSEWRDIVLRAFPEYELPPLDDSQDYVNEHIPGNSIDYGVFSVPEYQNEKSAYDQLYDYMTDHNYTQDDMSEYSKDPEWQRLVTAAFPDYEIPEDTESIRNSALSSGMKAIENTTEALRDDLKDKGFKSNGIEAITSVERGKLQEELLENLNGNLEYSYDKPDFEGMFNEIKNGRDSYDFSNIPIDYEDETYRDATHFFSQEEWDDLSKEERAESIRQLRDYIYPMLEQSNIPDIKFYNLPERGHYGYYSQNDNSVHVNEYMLDDGPEAADTVAHELWHAHQHARGTELKDIDGAEYVAAFEMYERSDVNDTNYRNQMVEAEARAFANTIRKGIRRRG